MQWEDAGELPKQSAPSAHEERIVEVGQSHFFTELNADSDNDDKDSVDDDFAALSMHPMSGEENEGKENADFLNNGWPNEEFQVGENNGISNSHTATLLDFGFGDDDSVKDGSMAKSFKSDNMSSSTRQDADLFDIGPPEPSNFDLLSGFGSALDSSTHMSKANSSNNVPDLLGDVFDPFQSAPQPVSSISSFKSPTITAATPAKPLIEDLFDPFHSNVENNAFNGLSVSGFDSSRSSQSRLGSSENNLINVGMSDNKPLNKLTPTLAADASNMVRNNSAPYLHSTNGSAKKMDPFADIGE